MEVKLTGALKQEPPIQKIENGLKAIVDRVSKAASPQEIARASISIKDLFKKALDETTSPKAQKKLSELFTHARQTLGMALNHSFEHVK